MIGKFASASALTLLVVTILPGAQGFAQTAPAEQTPAPATAAQPASPKPGCAATRDQPGSRGGGAHHSAPESAASRLQELGIQCRRRR